MDLWVVALAMVAVQTGFATTSILTKAAMMHGLSFDVFVFYRNAVGAAMLSPVAYFVERKTRPRLTRGVLKNIFLGSFLGITVNQFLYYSSMQYGSLLVTTALMNMVPAISFIMAVALRLEKVSLSTRACQVKLLGTVLSIGGAMVITFYHGPIIPVPRVLFLQSLATIDQHLAATSEVMKSVVLALGSSVFYSSWFIFQTKIGSSYSAQYSSTALMCVFATIQGGLGSLILQLRRPNWDAWKLGCDVRLVSILYSGVVASGICFLVMSWVIHKKGSLIVTVFTPIALIMVAIMSTIFLHEKLHLGSVVALVLIVTGVYAVVWGKSKEVAQALAMEQEQPENIIRGSVEEEAPENIITADVSIGVGMVVDDRVQQQRVTDNRGIDIVQQQRLIEDGSVPRAGAT